MGKLEFVGLMAGVVGLLGLHTLEAPVETRLLDTSGSLIAMTQPEFEAWCADRGATPHVDIDATRGGTVSCAWVDSTGEHAWHAALHFDGALAIPVKADAGLVEASESTLFRLVTNEFGSPDTNTGEGFPVWEVEVDGGAGLLTVAPFEDITVVRMTRTSERPVLSMR